MDDYPKKWDRSKFIPSWSNVLMSWMQCNQLYSWIFRVRHTTFFFSLSLSLHLALFSHFIHARIRLLMPQFTQPIVWQNNTPSGSIHALELKHVIFNYCLSFFLFVCAVSIFCSPLCSHCRRCCHRRDENAETTSTRWWLITYVSNTIWSAKQMTIFIWLIIMIIMRIMTMNRKPNRITQKTTAKAVIIKKFVTYHNRTEPKKPQINY